MGMSITGSDYLCGSSSETYALTNLPVGATVTWSAVPSNALSISGGGSTVTVTPTANFNNEATLRASISGIACGSMLVEKIISEEIINITDVVAVNQHGQSGIVCQNSNNNYFEIFTNPYLTGVTYEVQILHWPTLTTVYTTTTVNPITPLPVFSHPIGQYQIRARVIDHPCADGNWVSSLFECVDCTASHWEVSPNPIADTLIVSMNDKEDKNQSLQDTDLSSFSATLYAPNGNKVASRKGKGGKLTLDTSSIPEGSYLLHICAEDDIIVGKRVILIKR